MIIISYVLGGQKYMEKDALEAVLLGGDEE
jgi:hypothetical protein